jgi:diguanylate cyclase (GGDEF)-like protein
MPKSLRGRYLITAGILSTLLLMVAAIGWLYVKQSTGAQVQRIQQRTEAADAINDLESQIRSLEATLHEEIIQPGPVRATLLTRHFRYVRSAIDRLMNSAWAASDPVLGSLGEQLTIDTDRLETRTQELLATRQNVNEWFPAYVTMQERMLPNYRRFSSAVHLAIEESESALQSPGQISVLRLLTAARHAADQLVSEFRLMVANRFGIFSSEPDVGMKTRVANIQVFSQDLNRLLSELMDLDDAGMLGIQQRDSLQEMVIGYRQWLKYYTEVEATLNSGNWRRDLPILKDSIDPLVLQIRQRISSIRLELAVGSARDITQLTAATKSLSNFVVILAGAVILLLMLGYLGIRQSLLVPIGQISHALKAEANGHAFVQIPHATTIEARNLTEAFDEMRNQVRQRQAHLDFLAHHDPLTHLPNRVLFRDRLQNAINRSLRQSTRACLMFLDLDRFKQINDSLGHNTGDTLLKSVAKRLTHNVRHVDTVARLGGDEFAIIVEDISDPAQISIVADKILRAVAEIVEIESRQLHVTTSIGIATCPDDGTDVDTLTKNADTAMYHSKEQGPNGFTFYSAEMTARMTEFFSKELALRDAVARDEFTLFYQPIIDAKTGVASGCEALIRWQHPERGILAPGEFLEVLEDTDLITPVTHWVIERALSDFKLFRALTRQNFSLSINISARLLEEQSIVDVLKPALERNGIPPGDLIIEITEDTLMKRANQAERALLALKDIGVRIAIDDFGKGQSSLNRLRRFPIDIVKIDRDFVRDVPTDAYDSELVTAIVAMAHSLRKNVVAEGVETNAQYDFLLLNKCDHIQGYLFSKPISAESLYDFLSRDKRLCV